MSFEMAERLLRQAPEDEELLAFFPNPTRRVFPPGKERAQGFYLRPLETAASEALLVLRRRAARDSAACYTPRRSNQPRRSYRTLRTDVHTVRLIYPHDSPKNQLDGHLCTLARLRSSSVLAVTKEKAQEPWERQHKDSAAQCIHRQRKHHCGNSCLDAPECTGKSLPNALPTQRGECRAGLRNLVETMLTGQILVHWDFLCSLLGEKGTSLMRCELTNNTVLIGLMIPRHSLAPCLIKRTCLNCISVRLKVSKLPSAMPFALCEAMVRKTVLERASCDAEPQVEKHWEKLEPKVPKISVDLRSLPGDRFTTYGQSRHRVHTP